MGHTKDNIFGVDETTLQEAQANTLHRFMQRDGAELIAHNHHVWVEADNMHTVTVRCTPMLYSVTEVMDDQSYITAICEACHGFVDIANADTAARYRYGFIVDSDDAAAIIADTSAMHGPGMCWDRT